MSDFLGFLAAGLKIRQGKSEHNEIDSSLRRSPLTVLSCTWPDGTFQANSSQVILLKNFELNRAVGEGLVQYIAL